MRFLCAPLPVVVGFVDYYYYYWLIQRSLCFRPRSSRTSGNDTQQQQQQQQSAQSDGSKLPFILDTLRSYWSQFVVHLFNWTTESFPCNAFNCVKQK